MPRKKGTRSLDSQQLTSDALLAGRQTKEALSDESTWSDYPDSFFTDGTVKTLPGTCNILIVAPNMSPDTDDKNIGLLACRLAEALDAYAVINCQCYRKPIEGDPNPGELQLSDSPQPSKEDKRILKLRQRLLEETGGIPANLDEFWFVKKAAYDFVEPIWSAVQEIGHHAIPLAFFMEGIDDDRANEHEVDIAVAVGNLIKDDNKDEIHRNDIDSAPPAFVRELIDRLGLLKDGIRVREGAPRHNILWGDDIWWLRHDWKNNPDQPEEEQFRAEDLYSVLLTTRYTGFRDTKDNLIRTVKELAHAISGLTLFKNWQEREMAKKETKKLKKSKVPQDKPLKPRDATAVDEQTSGAGEAKTAIKKPAQSVQADVALISQEKFREKIEALRDQTTIKNDKGEEVAFDGVAKEVFISAFEEGYPVIERALSSIYELGSFLFDVRKKLKPQKIYYTWLEYAGIPERTASNYVQVYERYAESLPKFGHLGIKKLLTAARLKNCVEYVEKNERAIAEQSADELDKAVKALRSTKKVTGTGRGRHPTYIEIGKSRIRPSMDGTRLVIEGITKKKQAELIEAIKTLLS